MLKIIRCMKELDFSQLLDVYKESVHGRLAEDRLYDYLLSMFKDGGICALWYQNMRCVSALRLEPYRNGFLIAGLETMPEERGKGYATKLLDSLIQWAGEEQIQALFSHVKFSNRTSARIHKKCGFEQLFDYAVFLDGSVDTRCNTLYVEL